jgi:hypothetical protein
LWALIAEAGDTDGDGEPGFFTELKADPGKLVNAQLCWLALLLIRVVEDTTSDTWRNLRHELDRMHLVTLATPHGSVAQRSLTTPSRRTILAALDLPEPPSSSTSPRPPRTDPLTPTRRL